MAKNLRCRTCDAEIPVEPGISTRGRRYGLCDRCRTAAEEVVVETRAESSEPAAPPPPPAPVALRVETRTSSTSYRDGADVEHLLTRPARTRPERPFVQRMPTRREIVVMLAPWVLSIGALALSAGWDKQDRSTLMTVAILVTMVWTVIFVILPRFLERLEHAASQRERSVPEARVRVSSDAIERNEGSGWTNVAPAASICGVRAEPHEGRYRVAVELEDGSPVVVLDDVTQEEGVEIAELVRARLARRERG